MTTEPADAGEPRVFLRNAFLGGVVLAAVVAVVGAATSGDNAPVTGLTVLLSVLLVVSELRPMQWHPRAGEFTASWGFAGALAFVASPLQALGALAVASVVADLVTRKPVTRVLFNAATLVVSLAAGISLLEALGVRTVLVDGSGISFGFVASSVAFAAVIYLVNSALVSAVIRIDRGLDLLGIFRRVLPQTAVDDLYLLLMAPVFALVGLRSLLLLPLPLLGVAGMHRTARQASDNRELAAHDALTGLANRAEMVRALASAIGGGVTVVLLDLDDFKAVNDRMGHGVGDRVLEVVAARLKSAVRTNDVVARLGGDEFAVVLERASGREAQPTIDRIRAQFERPIEVDGVAIGVRASIGTASAPKDADEPAALLEAADADLYASKRARQAALPEPEERVRAFETSLDLLRDLKEGIERNELFLEFQPQVALATGATIGFEALVRWRRNDGRTMLPSEFVSAAVGTPLLDVLTFDVLGKALAACRRWRRVVPGITVSVNVSASTVSGDRFVDDVCHALIAAELPGSALELEIELDVGASRLDRLVGVTDQITGLGVEVTVDGFGTDSSSLVSLRRLPIHRVKIDRSLVGRAETPGDRRYLAATVDFAHRLGLQVVANGISSPAELDLVRQSGCDIGQGRYLSLPVTVERAEAWLASAFRATIE